MAKIEGYKRVQKESVPEEQRAIVDAFGNSINPLAEQVVNAFNGNITTGDNLNREYKQVDVEVLSSGNPKNTTEFQLSKLSSIQITGISVIKAENLTSSTTYPTGCPFISYTQNGRVITIKNITGLPASNKYRLTLEIHGK